MLQPEQRWQPVTKRRSGIVAILKYRTSAYGHGPKNPKFATKKFKTKLPAHEVGAIDLIAQITAWCWQRGIYQYESITFTRNEPLR